MHLQMIQGVIDRMAQCSLQLKGWSVTLAIAPEVFLRRETSPAYLFVSCPFTNSVPSLLQAAASPTILAFTDQCFSQL